MAKGSVKGRGAIAAAGLLVVLATALFVGVFYMYDGAGVVSSVVAAVRTRLDSAGIQPMAEPAAATDELSLPAGMPDDFALRVWEEQIESQRAIRPLVEGDVEALRISDAKVDGDEANVSGTLVFKDGSRLPGVLRFRRFAEVWYLEYVNSFENGATAREAEDPLPEIADVDVALLNTVIAEQEKSKAVTQSLVDGRIREFKVGSVRDGPNTVTVPLSIVGGPSEGEAELIVIRTKDDGEDFWFVTRFVQPGSTRD